MVKQKERCNKGLYQLKDFSNPHVNTRNILGGEKACTEITIHFRDYFPSIVNMPL